MSRRPIDRLLSPKEAGLEKVLYTQEAIQDKVRELGRRISEDYADKHPILISILKGALYFVADLTRAVSIPLHIDFMAITRYPGADDGSGAVRITKDLDSSIARRHVLIVEDVIDTGLTLGYLIRTLEPRRPASLNVCVLFDRPERRLVDLPVRYQGFRLSDDFVVGYGLDDGEEFRHLPYLAVRKKGSPKEGAWE